jgi:hypothetical protein
MPARSTTSEYQPAPPFNRLNRGKIALRTQIVKGTTEPARGLRISNMCVPPTQGDGRLFFVTPSFGA